MNNKVCALIITYNIDEKIIEVVNSIVNQVGLLVIVDNASNLQTIKLLERLNRNLKVKVIFNKKNYGIAKALNQGINFIKENKYEWVLTLDHDSVCEKDMIKNMLSILSECDNKDNIGILTPKIFEIRKQNFISKRKHENCRYIKVKDCIQSGSLIKLKVFDNIGYFNEDLFIYHVDFDFCQRLLKANYGIVQCNNVTLHHEEGYKVTKRFLGKKIFYNNYSSLAVYYITRNTIYMSKTYNVIYIKRIVKDFVFITLFDQKRKERLLYFFKGLHDGILNKYGKLETIPK